MNSVQLTKWGIERLQQNLQQHGNEHANLLSCMTLDVENLHSAVVHHKSQVSKAFQCARNFSRTAKEGLKRTAYWSVYYYTSRGSWYMVPDHLVYSAFWPCRQPPSKYHSLFWSDCGDARVVKNVWCLSTTKECQARDHNGEGWDLT